MSERGENHVTTLRSLFAKRRRILKELAEVDDAIEVVAPLAYPETQQRRRPTPAEPSA